MDRHPADTAIGLDGIAVIGMSGRFPGARTVEQLWSNLTQGVESSTWLDDDELRAAGVPERYIASRDFVKVAYAADDIEQFDAGLFQFTRREAEITDPQQRILLECCHEALEHAGYNPQRYGGLIGVYTGVGSMGYYIRNLSAHAELLEAVGGLRVSIGNEKSFAATMVSFKLDLRGPSVNVDTACSTSLVAVHQACSSLLAHECDMALAGGVSIDVPQKCGMMYREGGIVSPDGHCRPFDKDARGTVKGNGAGIVLLKRLEDALRDGDCIHAVIRGSAVNNDGALKVGYTASSVSGQVQVIADALARAAVPCESIGYIEAHGTGTALGDPVEVAALTEVFAAQAGRKQYCAIGSLKANIGHLDIAAGVAGLIKAVHCVREDVIPPSINYSEPNPNIDFKSSPFFVSERLRSFAADGHPRRAGVSSFGIGGTNAHVILEEPPRAVSEKSSRASHLLVLSARSQSSLQRQVRSLAEHLAANPQLELADAAYTLQLGRREFEHRAALVAASTAEAAQALLRGGRALLENGPVPASVEVCFAFPGQGAQHAGMTRDLYDSEPVFRAAFDRCAALFARDIRHDLKTAIFSPGHSGDELLQQTLLAQPALFTCEYALAMLWEHFGVRPAAMIGHSIGEYVAACLADVMTLEDAVSVVSLRARLMQSLPAGAMLVTHLSEADAAKYLSAQCSLAAVNGPNICVLSGPLAALERIRDELDAARIEHRMLRTSHAFHSWMMEPILEDFRRHLAGIELRPPKRPFISNVTGDWIDARQATDPAYWTQHLRQTVRFADGLARILDRQGMVLLEVGPSQVLTTLAKRSFGAGSRAIASCRHPQHEQPDALTLLQAVAGVWTQGVPIEWQRCYQGERRLRTPLPTYPFDRQRYWIGAQPEPQSAAPGAMPTTVDHAAAVSPAAGTENASLEERLMSVWRQAFGLQDISLQDNFFELGGDSLLATQLTSVMRDRLGLDISLSDLFTSPTLAGLLDSLQAKGVQPGTLRQQAPAIPCVEPDPARRHEPFPLTDIQQAYWVGRSGAVELGQVATHIYLEVDIKRGEVARFNHAWNRLIERHEMLRAIFLPSGEQRILPDVPRYEFETLDLATLDAAGSERRCLELRDSMSHQVLPADRWPLFDIRVLQFTPTRFRLCISIDVLIVDAWSMNMLIEQWLQLYQDPQRRLEELQFSFRDYILAEQALRASPLFEKSQSYWFDRIDTLPASPDLPLAVAPATLVAPRFRRRVFRLPRERWSEVKRRAVARGLTPSGVLLTAFAEVLRSWCRSPRFTVNLTLYSRHPFHPQVDQIVGDFTSLTLLEIDQSVPGSFESNAARIQRQLWQDLDHRFVSAIHVLREMSRRNGSRISMPVVFTSTLGVRSLEHETDVMDDLGEEGFGVSQTPQVWLDHQVMEWKGELRVNWDAVEALFPEGMIDSMFDAYCRLVAGLADGEQQWCTSSEDVMLPAEQAELLRLVNDTRSEYPPLLLHEMFEMQARRTPRHAAVITADTTLCYEELYRWQQGLAAELGKLDVQKSERIAVFLEKGWEQVAAVLGILAAGGAYLPIDPGLPRERIEYLIQHSGVRIVVGQQRLAERLPRAAVAHFVDFGRLEPASGAARPARSRAQPDDLAYVLYTSGSTGRPKGVMVPHRGAVNTLLDINDRIGLRDSDRVFALSALNFDLSVYDVFAPLARGAAIVMPAPEELRAPARWLLLVQQHGVTVWNSVPALMRMFVDHLRDAAGPAQCALRVAVLSGDWIPPSLPQDMHEVLPHTAVLGAGGPTECSIWSASHLVEPEDWRKESIPYGRPLRNQRIHILNELLETCPVWVPGELYVAGDGLALGYLADDERSNAVFLRHPRSGERLYKSGDLGRYLPNGDIEFLGRNDFQVKVNGHRIELGEIEAALKQHPGVNQVVVAATGEPGEKSRRRLVAYVTATAQAAAPAVSDTEHARLVEFKLRKPGLRRVRAGERVHALPAVAREPESYRTRKSYREYLGEHLTLERLSELLACVSAMQSDDAPLPKYRYASAGSLHAVQLYIYIKDGAVTGLPHGFYYHDPEEHRLVLVDSAALTAASFGTGENPHIYDRAAFSLIFVGENAALEPVYGAQTAAHFMLLEAGYMGQLLMEAAPRSLVGLCPIGYLDENIRERLALASSQQVLHCMVGGPVTHEQVASWSGAAAVPTPAGAADAVEQIKRHLRERLPEYMVPSSIVFLDTLPLTANGKIDRKALAERDAPSRVDRVTVAPRTDIERGLLRVWQEALGPVPLGVEDNFFEIGGDSVMIVRMHKRLAQMYGERLTVVDLFKYPKIAELAAHLSRSPDEPPQQSGILEQVERQRAAIARQRKISRSGT